MEPQDHFDILRRIKKKSNPSQRELAKELGFSLGKLNYCLKALKKKGLVKIKNFKKKKNKIQYLQYVITPKGVALRTKLTINFIESATSVRRSRVEKIGEFCLT